eukprot:scaffold50948_cov74-Phaeocystis_antarctica.AAC.3
MGPSRSNFRSEELSASDCWSSATVKPAIATSSFCCCCCPSSWTYSSDAPSASVTTPSTLPKLPSSQPAVPAGIRTRCPLRAWGSCSAEPAPICAPPSAPSSSSKAVRALTTARGALAAMWCSVNLVWWPAPPAAMSASSCSASSPVLCNSRGCAAEHLRTVVFALAFATASPRPILSRLQRNMHALMQSSRFCVCSARACTATTAPSVAAVTGNSPRKWLDWFAKLRSPLHSATPLLLCARITRGTASSSRAGAAGRFLPLRFPTPRRAAMLCHTR